MRGVSREGLSESLSGGPFPGFIKVLMLAWVRLWGVLVRLMGMGMISIIVPGQCERRAFESGVYFCMISW
jgi:hypothetical protein